MLLNQPISAKQLLIRHSEFAARCFGVFRFWRTARTECNRRLAGIDGYERNTWIRCWFQTARGRGDPFLRILDRFSSIALILS
ncbi:hypothetical protein ANCDUO_07942 [Ancylostoma duodenale]|uniref:Uncharacterized protein n=1 Tax=Ancylostoma duodenale TaxID=51022 RepID=A0A0C2GXC5_9BILA|nr:hypothetical protein ANCDUO_07942 [Ancylostoma duodenale]